MNISSWLIRVRAKKVTLQTFQIRITSLINLTYIILDLTFSTQVTMVTFCRGKLIFVSVFARIIPQIKLPGMSRLKSTATLLTVLTECQNNGSQLKNPDISGAPYTLRIQYSYTQTQCEDGARDARVL